MTNREPPKPSVYAAFQDSLSHELAVLESMTAAARDEATSAESRPENKYDTRALEASYLAAGQGVRLADLRQLVAWVRGLECETQERVEVGALVQVATDETRWVLIGPGGGPTVDVNGVAVALVSTRSPLGKALAGSEAGDAVEVEGPRGPYEAEVLAVR